MEFIKPGTYIDFMAHRKPVILFSLLLVIASIASVFYPGPNWGIDFAGGTEMQVQFRGDVTGGEIRQSLEGLGYQRPDVVAVEDSPNEFIIRVREVTAITEAKRQEIEEAVRSSLGEIELREIEFSPGGDKIAFRMSAPVEIDALQQTLEAQDVEIRSAAQFGKAEENRYEVFLIGVGDEIVRQLGQELGERGPDVPRRVEWVGPKAGEQLRDAAMKAMLYAIAFIMVYVAFRFDLRFAPGGVLALLHDAIITVGVYVLVQKEVGLTTVAALLTIIGYSINDTIVVFDRIRENMGRLRDKTLGELINISTSQMLSRTIVTSGTTLLSVSAFFIWGTAVIQDIAFALFIGILVGTYSSIYIAAPTTEWMDRQFFSRKK